MGDELAPQDEGLGGCPPISQFNQMLAAEGTTRMDGPTPGMKRLNVLLLLLSLSVLFGCSVGPGENNGGISMENWCNRDESMSWTGCWTETAQLDCATGQKFEPEEIIEEFRLTSDGDFSVTWSPFEHFVDYAGLYQVSEKNGTIEFTVGDNAPPNVDGQGIFTITDQGKLILENIWLGTRKQGNVTEACGHIFRLKIKK